MAREHHSPYQSLSRHRQRAGRSSLSDAKELSAKAALALNGLIDKRSLRQTETAAITGMTQPKISQVRRYKLQNISLKRLMQALVAPDKQVERGTACASNACF